MFFVNILIQMIMSEKPLLVSRCVLYLFQKCGQFVFFIIWRNDALYGIRSAVRYDIIKLVIVY